MARRISIFATIFLMIISYEFSFAGNITGKVISKRKKYRENTVVYVDSIPETKFTPPKEHVVMDQKDLRFIPHILPIVKGTTVDFHNSDEVLHNVFSPDQVADKFMEAYIVVLQNPYFALTDEEGNYVIENVPPGEYVIKVWHEKYKKTDPSEVKVTVSEKDVTDINFELKK